MSTKVSTDLIDLSSNTGGLVWAKGTTAQQPASATAGEMRVDTTTATTLVYNGTQWKTLKETAFVVPPIPTHFLVIAGGGGGGYGQGAGGGAGGFRTSYSTTGGGGSAESTTGISLNTAYTITVGAGGTGGVGYTVCCNGQDSIFSNITSTGGGAGGYYVNNAQSPGNSGGSGGGGGGFNGAGGSAASPTQGYAGGTAANASAAGWVAGGGGGGAGAIGGSGVSNGGASTLQTPGPGGAGLASSITGSSVTYAGGGGGSGIDANTSYNFAAGGTGGGGAGNGTIGTVNTGGGGGTGSWIYGGNGGAGGSGVVILRYPTADLPYFTTTGTLNIPSATDTVADTAYPVANAAYYKLDSNANDSSGNGYNGTATSITYAAGKFGNAAVFNGLQTSSASYIDISSATTTPVSSISFWFKTTVKNSTNANILAAGGSSSTRTGFSIRRNSSGFLNVQFTKGTPGSTQTVTGNQDITDGVWHNFILSMASDNTFVVYLDGQSHISGTRTHFTNGQSRSQSFNRFGSDSVAIGANAFGGSIDQVRIFSSALAAEDVEDLYNEHFQTKFTDGSDTALMFTGGTGDITFLDTDPNIAVNYLVVAGGGGGGAGGGGGGGVLTNYGGTSLTLSPNINYSVAVGVGGAGAVTGNNLKGTNGTFSTFSSITADGGGGGGGFNTSGGTSTNGLTGGSGGGGGYAGGTGGSNTSGQGFVGGTAIDTSANPYNAAGGGGAGAAGSSDSGNVSGNGGIGLLSNITGTTYYWGGGGGGGAQGNGGVAAVAGNGGNGGGGGGACHSVSAGSAAGTGGAGLNSGGNGLLNNTNTDGGDGGANTGGGGGANGIYLATAGTGGSGVVILRYSNTKTITVGSGLTATTAADGTDSVTTFTAGTGTITFS